MKNDKIIALRLVSTAGKARRRMPVDVSWVHAVSKIIRRKVSHSSSRRVKSPTIGRSTKIRINDSGGQ